MFLKYRQNVPDVPKTVPDVPIAGALWPKQFPMCRHMRTSGVEILAQSAE